MRYRGGRERGISFVGLMFVLIVLACVLLLSLKLFPIYTESFKIDKAMKGVIADSEIGKRSRREIQNALIKQFDIDAVTVITNRTIGEHLEIQSQSGIVSLDIHYEAETALFGNISLLVTFEKHVEN